jgi:tRNA-2-methylthio-N6-dimethylallyladenosine synthase
MPYLHLPVQSGNNEILRLMGRGYTVERFKMIYDKLKEAIPNIAFSTDMIVGFPNETREQFEDTLKLVDYCKFDFAFIFIYSPRAGTPAAKFIDNIDSKEKSERLQELNERVAKYGNLNNQKYLNKVVKVLVDGKSKRNDEVYSGYSEENKLVNFTGKNIKEGDIVEVLITEIKSWSMNGEKIN